MKGKSLLMVVMLVTLSTTSNTSGAVLGEIVPWGSNHDNIISDTPTGSSFVKVEGGMWHALALKSDGSIVSWGSDSHGQVSNTPNGSGFVDIAAGLFHALALTSGGSIVSWGDDHNGQVSNTPDGSGFVGVAAGSSISFALRSDGSIIAWGADSRGEVSGAPKENGFIRIAAGHYNGHALKSDGSIVSWGSDSHGQVSGTPAGSGFVDIAAGLWYALGLKADGSIVSWGFDDYGQVSSTPTGSGFVDIAVGDLHALALKEDGSIVSWGFDDYGQVSNTPTHAGFADISAGHPYSLAITPQRAKLMLLSPNGNELIYAESIISIAWDTDERVRSILLEYSTDNGSTWTNIDIVSGKKSYQWTVPQVTSAECLVRASDSSNTTIFDVSDHTFTICTPSVALLAPNGNETVVSGQQYDVTWASECEIESVLLEFSVDAGNNWTTVEVSANTGSYRWPVPEIHSEECLIRISDADHPEVNDASDALFSVYPSLLTLTAPNGGEALIAGLSYSITWLAEGTAENIRLEYSHNAGDTWTGIATTANTGSYLWALDGPQSHEYLIRISDADFPNISDTSDSTFTVSTCQDAIAGDVNGDCIVNLLDLAMIAQNWLTDGYVRIFLYDLAESPNWTSEGQWEYGQPLGLGGSAAGYPDPSAGFTGSNVYGVNLSGDYTVAVGGPYSLIAGPFDCRSFHDLKIRFARWLNADGPDWVSCKFEVSSNGSDWQEVWQNDSEVTDSQWQVVEYDVSVTADNQRSVYFRWTYAILHDRAYACSGWNIDDVELLGKR